MGYREKQRKMKEGAMEKFIFLKKKKRKKPNKP
uniref:Uncharacterized protein n=1 Tax=Rhizophora mucronata TaxID=61149 RepID=A0A2P2JBW9_RHIMU